MTTMKGVEKLTSTRIKGWLDSVMTPLEAQVLTDSYMYYHSCSTLAVCKVGKKDKEVQAVSHSISTWELKLTLWVATLDLGKPDGHIIHVYPLQ